MKQSPRSLIALLLGALLLVACAQSDPAAPLLCQNDAECPAGQVCRSGRCAQPGPGLTDGGAASDGGVADGGLVDGGSTDGGLLDGGSEDGGLDAGLPDAGTLAGFGERCGAHPDCESQICLALSSGSICTRLCSNDCPTDYVCKAFVLERDRIVNLCIPFGEVYCVPCAQASECPAAEDQCTAIGGATYCTRDCAQTDACPPGFSCQDVPYSQTAAGQAQGEDGGVTGDGGAEPVFRQCLPTSGQCPGCVDADGDGYGAGSGCLGPDCDDTRASVNPGAQETCNGRDDNCDGTPDETFDLQSDHANCGACGVACDISAGQRCCGGTCVDTRTSADHCGGCGHPCTGAGAACCDGTCQETQNAPDHCGACGQPCTNEHGSVACAQGVCAPTCTLGWGDCDQDPRNGCETATTTLSNCGVCGTACRNPNGTTDCVGGSCAPRCDAGWGNCDGDDPNGCETDLLSTTEHCNRCGLACVNPHGLTSCSGGTCRPVCETNWGDCDGDPQNGCETDLAGSTAHCGACNVACANEHGTTQCQGGVCSPTCAESYADCDNNPRNGCETDTRSSILHCGACNVPCTNTHGTTTCAAGACVPTCEPGWADCDGNPNNGCETNLATSPQHCGGCNQPCLNDHGSVSCVDRTCEPGCDPSWGDCDGRPRNGCETPLNTSTDCLACGTACSNPHGTTSCGPNGCAPICDSGWASCDGNPNNGCETSLSSPTHCGACNLPCDLAHASESCATGTCVLTQCDPGWRNCDGTQGTGCETDITTTANCGDCGRSCTNDHGGTTCSGGLCVPSCATGFGDCDGNANNGCETPLTTLSNCGACGQVCDLAHALESCSTGSCTLVACAGGWGNCDNNPATGCETPLTTTSNCGSCGRSCSNEHGTTACVSGGCAPTCAPGWGDCDGNPDNGCETPLNTTTNCGACGQACDLAHAAESCSTGSCRITSCESGWDNCDSTQSNGCETQLGTTSNCGACGISCTNPHGTTSCVSGACTPVCSTGWGSCDNNLNNGCERSLRTVTDCGACNQVCSLPNASEFCSSTGVCSLASCDAGFSNCDGNTSNGCEVAHGAYSNACGSAENLGSKCGDTSCGFICGGSSWNAWRTRSGRNSRWYKARVSECSDCPFTGLTHRITLSVPAGVNYDLYIWSSCGTLWTSSRNGTGATERVTISRGDDLASDESYDYWIEVRYVSGASCTNWSLAVEGRDC